VLVESGRVSEYLPEIPAKVRSLPLWKVCLWSYGASAANNLGVLHPLDVDRAKELLRDLHDLGERPSYVEFTAYLKDLWPEHPGTQKTFRDLWRRLLRNPHHQFRLRQAPVRFYTVDRVCRAAELESLEDRLRRRITAAADAALDARDEEGERELQRELEASVEAIKDLRKLRQSQRDQATQRASASSSR